MELTVDPRTLRDGLRLRAPVPGVVALWAVGVVTFASLATLAVFFDRFPFDLRVARAFQGLELEGLGGFFRFVNALGRDEVYPGLTFALAGALFALRARTAALLILLTFVPRFVNTLLKIWIERPRPDQDLLDVRPDVGGFGFPSGHTVGATVLFGLLFLVIPAVVPWRPLRWTLQAGCGLIVVASGPARCYIGVHWPSDVLAGYLLAFLFLLPLAAIYQRAKAGKSLIPTLAPAS